MQLRAFQFQIHSHHPPFFLSCRRYPEDITLWEPSLYNKRAGPGVERVWPPGFDVIMQRDNPDHDTRPDIVSKGSKQYCAFCSLKDAADFVLWYIRRYPAAQACFYETIRDKKADQVHMVFDLERDLSAEEAATAESRLQACEDTWGCALQRIKDLLSIDIKPGVNCQVR